MYMNKSRDKKQMRKTKPATVRMKRGRKSRRK